MKAPVGPLMLLALAVLFALPFMEFSCRGRTVVQMTGYEAVFGKKLEAQFPIGEWLGGSSDHSSKASGSFSLFVEDEHRTEGNRRMLAAWIATMIGGVAAFFWRPAGVLGGVIAFVLLLVIRADVIKELVAPNAALLQVKFVWGYWLSLGFAGLGSLACLWRPGTSKQ